MNAGVRFGAAIVVALTGAGIWASSSTTPAPTARPTVPVTPLAPALTPSAREWDPLAPQFALTVYVEADMYPCMDCHEDEGGNPMRRPLEEEHDDIELSHGPESRWCLDCHDLDNRDRLELAGGSTIAFPDSTRLCGQCHGHHLRDWRLGIHGKVTGNMFAVRTFRRCVDCHDPHSPAFWPIKPEPAPVKP